MRLSRFTDIGLRTLMYLGSTRQRASARRVADLYGVSKDHVMKSLQALSTLGLVESAPGRIGGFTLSCDPAAVRIGSLIRQLEPNMDLAECFTADSACPLTPGCGLAGALAAARDAFLETMDRYTLEDLVRSNHSRLVQLHHAEP